MLEVKVIVANVVVIRDPLFRMEPVQHYVGPIDPNPTATKVFAFERRCIYSGTLRDMQDAAMSQCTFEGRALFSLKGRRRYLSFMAFLSSLKDDQRWAEDLFEWLKDPPLPSLTHVADWKEPVVEFKFEQVPVRTCPIGGFVEL